MFYYHQFVQIRTGHVLLERGMQGAREKAKVEVTRGMCPDVVSLLQTPEVPSNTDG